MKTNTINIIHDIEELAELQKELTKALRGKLRRKKLIEEFIDVEIAMKNIKDIFKITDDEIRKGKLFKKKKKRDFIDKL